MRQPVSRCTALCLLHEVCVFRRLFVYPRGVCFAGMRCRSLRGAPCRTRAQIPQKRHLQKCNNSYSTIIQLSLTSPWRESGDTAVLETLLAAKADPERRGSDGLSGIDTVKLLVAKLGGFGGGGGGTGSESQPCTALDLLTAAVQRRAADE